MVLERDVDGLPSARFTSTDEAVNHHYFVKVEWDSDLRFCTRVRDWTGALDPANGESSSEIWYGGELGPTDVRVSQTNTAVLEVSSVSFANLDDGSNVGPWLNRDLVSGLKNRKVTIWQAVWPPYLDEDDDIEGRFIIFRGRIGAREHGEVTTLSLLPFRTSWSMKTGSLLLPTVCRFAMANLFKDPETCQYGGSETTCDGALTTCQSYGNEIHFGGHPLMLKPNTVIQVGTQRFTV